MWILYVNLSSISLKFSSVVSNLLLSPPSEFLTFRYFFNLWVQLSCSVVSASLRLHSLQRARPPCPSPTPGVCSSSTPVSRWCRPTISPSVVPFSSRLQSFPAAESFPMSQLFESDGQSIRVSASTSAISMNTQDWSPLGWTGWISLQSKRLSNTTVQKHQCFGTQLSL